MAQNLEIYKCPACGNIVEVLHSGVGSLTCCGAAMQLMVENTVDASREKHVPVIEQAEGVVTITVGSVPHPMEEAHYIEWVELIADGKADRQFLKPGAVAKAIFTTSAKQFTVREYCNLHGHWSAST